MHRRLVPVIVLTFLAAMVPIPLNNSDTGNQIQLAGTIGEYQSQIAIAAAGELETTGGSNSRFEQHYPHPDQVRRSHAYLESPDRRAEERRRSAPVISVATGSAGEGSNASVVGWSSASISNFHTGQNTAPYSITIPSLDVEARIEGVGADPGGEMIIPNSRNTVGWYEHGPIPGDPGSAVIAGHYDDHRGRGVFYDLKKVKAGATIRVAMQDGATWRFEVVETVSYDNDRIPADRLFSREGDPTLAMVTCGGRFDRSTGQYAETLVVFAVPKS